MGPWLRDREDREDGGASFHLSSDSSVGIGSSPLNTFNIINNSESTGSACHAHGNCTVYSSSLEPSS